MNIVRNQRPSKNKLSKCDLKAPCSNCVKNNRECVPVLDDKRRDKYTKAYVRTLEDQISDFEQIMWNLANSNNEERSDFFEKFKQNQGRKDLNLNIKEKQEKHNNSVHVVINDSDRNDSLAVYGSSSVYIPKEINKKEIENKDLSVDNNQYSDFDADFEKFQNPWIMKCISSFFIWRYPDLNIFIHRESFLTDFFRHKDDIKNSLPYCSQELIYALCSIGAKTIPEEERNNIQSKTFKKLETSIDFYEKSKFLIFQKLQTPSSNSIPVIQTLLCLSLYDLGRGYNMSAWICSGIAFRIGQHMGFELDPSEWQGNVSILSDYDMRVKSRIYWGCYIADHFISLVLGRHPALEASKATIPDSDDLPSLIGIEQFIYQDSINVTDTKLDISNTLKNLVELYKIGKEYQFRIINTDTSKNLNEIYKFNLKLMDWRKNLSTDFRWKKNDSKTYGNNPVIMNLRYSYYFTGLCFNKVVLTAMVNEMNANELNLSSPETFCFEIIDELYNSLISFKSKNLASQFPLLVVFTSILSIRILLSVIPKENLMLKKSKKLRYLNFFVEILRDCSPVWELAREYYISIKNSVQDLKNDNNDVTGERKYFEDCNNQSHLNNSLYNSPFLFNDELITFVDAYDLFDHISKNFDKI